MHTETDMPTEPGWLVARVFGMWLLDVVQVCNGLKPKVFEHYKREVVHAYGVQHIITFYRLECSGLLRLQQQASKTYSTLRK